MTTIQIDKIKKDLYEHKFIVLYDKENNGYGLITPIESDGKFSYSDTDISELSDLLNCFINNPSTDYNIDEIDEKDWNKCRIIFSGNFDKLIDFIKGDYISINGKMYKSEDIEKTLDEHNIKPIM